MKLYNICKFSANSEDIILIYYYYLATNQSTIILG